MPPGEGPGPITLDGCAVDGCGVGRMTRHLLAKGHGVTVVDNSRDMLSHVPEDAEKICSDIELLRLDRKFDVVLLASCLINTPDESVRLARLTACHRHLRAGGRLLFQRFDPQWLRSAERGRVSMMGEVELGVDEIRRSGDLVAISLRYATQGKRRPHRCGRSISSNSLMQVVMKIIWPCARDIAGVDRHCVRRGRTGMAPYQDT
jgi:SAM-dependent methyltransferase